MKKLTILFTFICLASITFAQKGEEEGIKKAIQARSDANRNRDLAAWKASWQHDPKASNTFISKNGYNNVRSWDSIEVMMERDIKQNPKPDNTMQVKMDNFSIRMDGNLAMADYDAIFTPVTDQSSIFPYTGVLKYHNYDVLVKKNGQWKTNSRIVTLPQSYNPDGHAAEIDMNTAGYDLLAAKKVNEAIEVFKLNVKLFPDSWNVYDSLGEAYAAAGNTKEAIANYERSIQLNPKSDSEKEALTKLKQK